MRTPAVIVALAAALIASACAPPVPASPAASSSAAPDPSACAKVEALLTELSGAADPVQYAEERGIELSGSSVRVIIDVYGDQSLATVPGIIERRDGTMVQALVAPHRLCDLAMASAVRAVRLAYQPLPLNGAQQYEDGR